MRNLYQVCIAIFLVCVAIGAASAQTPPASQGGGSFQLQCPTSTVWHPGIAVLGYDPALQEGSYTGPQTVTEMVDGVSLPYTLNGGGIKCQQVSGGDGYMTEADGNQTFMFSFGPLSGLNSIWKGQPGTQFATGFNLPYCNGATYNSGQPNPYWDATANPPACMPGTSPDGAVGYVTPTATNPNPGADSAAIMNTGVLNGNIPAPLVAIDEDDELFLTLTNVGMIMRPDLFEQHTIHFHGYPNASSFYDGVPDASLAVNIGGSFTYYYLAPDAGTYFWHCHITPPEHLQMGMVGQLYVRPRQNRVATGPGLFHALQLQQNDLRTACNTSSDILCSVPLPLGDNSFPHVAGYKYAYNDGDGSTRYDVDVPLQIHGFDPNFHFVGMTFNPEGFADMKDKYFLLNGRSYPDTIAPNAISTESSDGQSRPSQPMPALITLKSGQRALLRISDLDVTEYQTLASLGIPMQVVGFNAKLLRDQAGNNLYVTTNSITLGGGESMDVILDSTGVQPGTYFLYTPNLDHLSNDAENFGGLMTEVVVQ